MDIKIVEIINRFIREMGYLENEHVLGVFFYGSYLSGFYNSSSDIDLHVVFDDSDLSHLIRGNKYVDGIRIEYFETPISDEYMTVDNEFLSQNNSVFSILGTSIIMLDKTGELKQLQDYTISKYSNPLEPLDSEEAREYVSILNNRMERVRRAAFYREPQFDHLYHLTLEKIRKFYHRLKGLPKISTSKVFRVYTDEEYRKSFYREKLPDEEFVSLYLIAITDINADIGVKLEYVEKLYKYAKRDVCLEEGDYRIHIKSRNIQTNQNIHVRRLVPVKKTDRN